MAYVEQQNALVGCLEFAPVGAHGRAPTGMLLKHAAG